MNSFFEALLTIFLLVAILFAAWYVTKYTAGKMQKFTRGRYIEVIDQVFLGRDRGIVIVRVGGKVYLVGFTSNSMERIAEIPEDQLMLIQDERPSMEFKNIIKHYLKDYNPFRSDGNGREKDRDR